VIQELSRLAFANIHDFMRVTDEGDPYLDFSAITKEQATTLAEFTVDDFKDGRGEDAGRSSASGSRCTTSFAR
jgi:phage terminase small subunit